jgi:hypothetical protein
MPTYRQVDREVLLLVPRSSGTRRTPNHHDGIRVQVAALPDRHVAVHEGLVLTSPARTAIDVMRSVPIEFGVALADAVLRSGLATAGELDDVRRFERGWPGSRRARVALLGADARSESPGESASRVFFARYGIPMPEPQVEIHDEWRGFVGRVDFLWRQQGVAGEFDGMTKYDDPASVRMEKFRQDGLTEGGLAVVRWTTDHMVNEPERTAARIMAALRRPAEPFRAIAGPTTGPSPAIPLHLLERRTRRRVDGVSRTYGR